MRIGQGFDAHAFCAGHGITLGGVLIPCSWGLAAHSDGDVLLHALCDALLGAAGLGDLGSFFPESTVPENCDSRVLLRQVAAQLRQQDFKLINMDATLIAQKPRLQPFVADMCQLIAADLQFSPTRVNIKSPTTDGLGFTGRKEGIAATVVVLLTDPGSLK